MRALAEELGPAKLVFVESWPLLLAKPGDAVGDPALFRDDKFHMNEDGYAIWDRELAKVADLKKPGLKLPKL